MPTVASSPESSKLVKRTDTVFGNLATRVGTRAIGQRGKDTGKEFLPMAEESNNGNSSIRVGK
jgi:hypothetical protein